MRPTRIALFVIAFLIIGSQTFRHAYVRWLEPRGSVLDRYAASGEKQAASAKSLEELAALYDQAHKKVEEYEKAHPVEPEDRYKLAGTEPYKSEAALENAIKDWEEKNKEVHEMWHFWIFGVLLLGLGWFVTFRGDRWVALGVVVLAFCEMVYATSPSLRNMFGSPAEFDRLLTQKFILSLVTFALLLVAWRFSSALDAREG